MICIIERFDYYWQILYHEGCYKVMSFNGSIFGNFVAMTIEEARQLIAGCNLLPNPSQWADLGCGNGIFSYALAGLLPAGSSIICVDKAAQRIDPLYNGVSLQFKQADVENIELGALDGILMANALHYVKDQAAFVKRMEQFTSSFIIIEYDTDSSNPWVPYPISFKRLQQLFKKYDLKKLGERPSMYGRANLYACQARHKN